MKKFILFIGFVLVCFKSFGITIIVTNGNDVGLGSFRAALGLAVSGDVIAFNPAVTTVTLTSPITNADIIAGNFTINGDLGNGNRVLITGNIGSELFDIVGKPVSFQNMIFTNLGGGVLNITNELVSMENCIFESNLATPLRTSAGLGTVLNVYNSIFRNNSGSFGGVIYADGGSANFVNCIAHNNTGGATFFSWAGDIQITNCTITDNNPTNQVFETKLAGRTIQVHNSIIWDNNGKPTYVPTTLGDFYIQYSLVPNTDCTNIHASASCGLGMIYNSDPLFVNAGANDYRLQVSSPCIDQGNDAQYVGGYPTSDLGNKLRKLDISALANGGGGFIDMGAYEFMEYKPAGNTGLYFDGQNDYVNVTNHPITADFSIEFWIKTSQTGTPIGTTYWQEGYGLIDNECICGDGDFGLSLANGKILFGAADNIVDYTSSSNATVNDNRWHHITMTRTQATGLVELYIDGVLDISVTHSSMIYGTNQGLQFGKIRTGSNFFNGQLDEIRMFNTVRTPAEIAADMFDTSPITTNLVGYWNFNQGTGTTANDIQTNTTQNNGTLINNPLWAFRVTNTADALTPPVGALRWAINQTNANIGQQSYIDFSIQQTDPTIAGKRTITLASVLPDITESVIIDGYSAYGSAPNTNAFHLGNNAEIRIELDCINIGSGVDKDGLILNGSNNSIIKGLAIDAVPSGGASQYAINIKGTSTNNRIEGCYLGFKADGSALSTNMNGIGITGAGGNTVGWDGTLKPAAFNLIGNNTFVGLAIDVDNNTIQGNYIGTDRTGVLAYGNNQRAIVINGNINQILNNLVSGSNNFNGANILHGTITLQAGAANNSIKGNLIGTQRDGITALPNTNLYGISLIGGSSNNTIGGTAIGEGNVIANNQDGGILVDGVSTLQNAIRQNQIYANTGGGISLTNNGNADKIAPSVSTFLINFIDGTSEPNDIIEFFADSPQTGITDQGRKYLGTTTADGLGNWTFTTVGFPSNSRITATTTSPTNNTSIFVLLGITPDRLDIIDLYPSRNALNVAVNDVITTEFTADPDTPDNTKIKVIGSQTGTYTGSFDFNNPLTFTPDQSFKAGETLTVAYLTTLLGTSDEQFLSAHQYQFTAASSTAFGSFFTAPSQATGTSPQSVCSFDADNDGDLDLAVANLNTDDISIFINQGDGTYAPQANFAVGSMPIAVVAFDADQDGYMDLAVANFGGVNQISVLINDQTADFSAKTDYSTSNNPSAICAYDADNDGDMDLAVTNYNSNTVLMLYNDGTGDYPLINSYSTGANPNSIFAFDVENDGDMDLAVANYGSNDISVLYNNGMGGYPTKFDYTTGANPKSIYAFNADGDEYMDLAVAHWSVPTDVVVLRNNGDGTYPLTGDSYDPQGGSLAQVIAFDADGDGDMDLGTANGGSANVSILKNDGTGIFSFSAINQFSTPAALSSLSALDADLDGDMDLAVTSGSVNTVSILFNSAVPIVVGNTNDSGAGSLRQAILDANLEPNPNVIEFNLPIADPNYNATEDYWKITLLSSLPITQPLIINGYSQAGATPNTNPFGEAWNGILKIQISGENIGGDVLRSISPNTHIKGLNFVSSIRAVRFDATATDSSVGGCLIGTSIDGTVAAGNQIGIFLQTMNHTIGGWNDEDRNVISGNGEGIRLDVATNNKIIGNYIGTDIYGTTEIPNNTGVYVFWANNSEITQNLISGNSTSGIYLDNSSLINISQNRIGTDGSGYWVVPNLQYGIVVDNGSTQNAIGSFANGGNTISANGLSQIYLATSGGNIVQANYIGTNIDGESLGFTTASAAYGIVNVGSNNAIGGSSPDDGNVISGNLGDGIYSAGVYTTIQNNKIGISASYVQLGNALKGINMQDGAGGSNISQNIIAFNYESGVFISVPTPLNETVTISQNSIYNNYGIGIDLLNDPAEEYISLNDPQDFDIGANGMMNYPEFPAGSLADYDANDDIVLSLAVPTASVPENYPLTIEFFVSDGERQGKTYVGSAIYGESDAEQMVTVTFTPQMFVNLGSKLVATATDTDGNTSEFSSEISLGFDCGLRPYITDVVFETNARCNLEEHEVTFKLSYNSPVGLYNVDWDGDGEYDAYDVETDDYGHLTLLVPNYSFIYYPVVNSVDYPDCDSEPFEIEHFLDSDDLNPLEIDYVELTHPTNCESSDGIVTITLAGEAPIAITYYDVDLDGDGTFEFLTVPDNLANQIVVEGVKGGTKIGNITIQNSWYLNCEVSYFQNEIMPFTTVTRTDLPLKIEKNTLDFEETGKITIENSEKGISYALIFATGASRLASDFVTSTGGTLTLSTPKLIESNGIGVLARNAQGCEATFDIFTSVSVANGIFTDQFDILRLIFNKTGGEEWKQKWSFQKPYKLQGVTYNKGDITEIDLSYNNLIDELPWQAILSLKKLKSLNVEGNKLTFKSLQGLANAPFTFKYAKQAKINKELTFTTVETATVTLKIEVEGSGLEYQWYKDKQTIIGETSATLVLKDVSPSQSGTYHATVRSKDLPDLIILRDDIKLTVLPQIKAADLSLLRAFYESLNGNDWTNKWNFNDPNLANWFGIVLQNGKIVSLSLTNNNLVGELNPLAFQTSGFFTEIENLNLSGNSIKGKLPEGLKNLKKLKRLDFSDTNFENDIWEIITQMPNLEALIFLNAQIKYIPEKISNLANLKVFVLDKNLITSIPLGLGKLENLQILHLAKNEIETLPDIFKGLKNLERLHFHQNKIKNLPRNLGLTSLLDLTLSSNLISELPEDLRLNLNLQWLEISNNLLDFNDLEKILAKKGGRTETDLRIFYAPQANFGTTQEATLEQGSSYVIKSQTSGNNNTYTWLQNGISIRRLNQPTNGDYVINNVSKVDAGTYTVMVTNPIAPDLTLYSQDTKITVTCATQIGAKIELVGNTKFCAEDKASKTLTINNLSAGSTVQWFKDGLRIFGGVTPRLTTFSEGVYRAFITDSEGCSNFASAEIRLERIPAPTAEIIADSANPALLKIRNPENYTNFQWFRDFEPLPEGIGATWQAAQLGVYQVKITDRNGCLGLSNQFTITPTATEQDFENEELRIYPNPASEIVQVEIPAKYSQNYRISLWNAQGQEVRQANKQNSFDVSDLPSSLYLVKVSLEGKEIWKKVQVVR